MCKMKYRISQEYETLGDTRAQIADSLEAAEALAEKLRADIVQYVRAQEVRAESDTDPLDGWMSEILTWTEARNLSETGKNFSEAAGKYIAEQAVKIEILE